MSFYISPLVSQAMSSIIFTFGTAVGLVTVLVIASMSTAESQLSDQSSLPGAPRAKTRCLPPSPPPVFHPLILPVHHRRANAHEM
ncbi:hypothetical protein L208DRAFT_1411036 [Tricholoma matsutake]|nr:hypothetical protein L208DRAFT_1411036 [Tricholoma matsutake 945]